MPEKKKGRPIGSKDSRPRKQKLSIRTSGSEISSDSPAPAICDARPHFYALRQNPECHENYEISTKSEQDRHASVPHQQLVSYLHFESSDEAAVLTNGSLIEDEREAEEASIDDQLHTWAQSEHHWIIDPALSLDGENPWDRALLHPRSTAPDGQTLRH
jgi:hypothetical protein